ncbi:MAG: hypothetical protein L0387_44930, partial [Acidobacteria bacterium]|nr:hypothetical protein [Acidobacteriota bacterium]MCI0719631.1 hypothetical protein [Acidobacteriota bacterium]
RKDLPAKMSAAHHHRGNIAKVAPAVSSVYTGQPQPRRGANMSILQLAAAECRCHSFELGRILNLNASK